MGFHGAPPRRLPLLFAVLLFGRLPSVPYEEHLAFCRPLVEEIRPVFRPETNADMLLHRIFDTMLSFASRVLSGEVENSEKNRETDI